MYIHIYLYRAIIYTYLYTDVTQKKLTLHISYKKCNKDWKVLFAQANCVAVKPSQLHIVEKKVISLIHMEQRKEKVVICEMSQYGAEAI